MDDEERERLVAKYMASRRKPSPYPAPQDPNGPRPDYGDHLKAGLYFRLAFWAFVFAVGLAALAGRWLRREL
jgi:hypothetical protein